jgi:WD40 repeat protein
MELNVKNTIILLFFGFTALPFLLMNDFIPFYRLGMFAEPVRSVPSGETFQVVVSDSSGQCHLWDYRLAHLPNDPAYLFRNYHYRQQGELLLKQLSKLPSSSGIRSWELRRILLPAADTLVVATYIP